MEDTTQPGAEAALDLNAEIKQLNEWAWSKPGDPLGRMHGADAAREAWLERARRATPTHATAMLTDAQISAGAAVMCDCPEPRRIGRNAAIAVFDAMGATPTHDVGAPSEPPYRVEQQDKTDIWKGKRRIATINGLAFRSNAAEREEAEKIAAALNGSTATPPASQACGELAMPEGLVLVPKIPTPKMIDAAHLAENCGHGDKHFLNVYRAMIAATPPATTAAHPQGKPDGAQVAKVEPNTAREHQLAAALVDLMAAERIVLTSCSNFEVQSDFRTRFARARALMWGDGVIDAATLNASESAAAPERSDKPAELTQAARDVLAERRRQVEQEGWTPEHDDQYTGCEMAAAAATYAVCDRPEQLKFHGVAAWPWKFSWFKPTTYRRNLVKAGALVLAEIERLDRATHQPPPSGKALPAQEGESK